VITIIDIEPAGLLIRAYNQETNSEYTLSPSESQLKSAGLTRSDGDLTKLADSIDVKSKGGENYISSALPAILDNKVRGTGSEASCLVCDERIES